MMSPPYFQSNRKPSVKPVEVDVVGEGHLEVRIGVAHLARDRVSGGISAHQSEDLSRRAVLLDLEGSQRESEAAGLEGRARSAR